MPYRPIVGTLAYLWDRDCDRVLLVHRNARSDDEHLGKYNGLGGKLEADEDVVSSLRRELLEEACVELTDFVLRATISWPGFGANGEDWLGFVFLVTGWSGTVPSSNAEGTLSWVARTRLLAACAEGEAERAAAQLPMWEGDRWFLPMVFDTDPRACWGVMPYAGGRPTDWRFTRM